MFKYFRDLFTSKCDLQYTRKYLECIRRQIYTINMYDKVDLLHDNIQTYIKIMDILIEFDYTKHVHYDTYSIPRMNRETYVMDFYTVNNTVLTNQKELLNTLIDKTMRLIDIRDTLIENSDNKVNHFNSKRLYLYIINVCNIVNVINNKKDS